MFECSILLVCGCAYIHGPECKHIIKIVAVDLLICTRTEMLDILINVFRCFSVPPALVPSLLFASGWWSHGLPLQRP